MLKCTKEDSVRSSVPALGKRAPGLAGFYTHTVYRVLVMSGKGFIYSTKCFLIYLFIHLFILFHQNRSISTKKFANKKN